MQGTDLPYRRISGNVWTCSLFPQEGAGEFSARGASAALSDLVPKEQKVNRENGTFLVETPSDPSLPSRSGLMSPG